MRRVLGILAIVVLASVGFALIAGHGYMLTTNSDPEVRTDAAIIGGLGIVSLIAAALVFGLRATSRYRIRSIPLVASSLVFIVALVVGSIGAYWQRWPALTPILAVASMFAVAAFIAALAMRWAPGRSAVRRVALGSGLWGMVGATTVALVLELLAVVVLFAGGVLGLYLADPELVRGIGDRGLERVIDESGSQLATTTTVMIAIGALYAVLAPMSEEFGKLLGTMFFLPRRATRYDAFIGGVFAGLGFASVESLMYALAAGDRWPLLIALRAPIALVHVAAASLAALSWQATRAGKRFAVARGYGSAVLVHGSWNGLIVAVLLITASAGDPDHVDPASAVALTGIIGLMGLHLLGCFTLLVTAARKYGREAADIDGRPDERPPTGSETYFDRTTTLSRAPIGSV